MNLDVHINENRIVDTRNSNLTSIGLTNLAPTYTGRIEFNENSSNDSLVEIIIRDGGTSYSIEPGKSRISFRVDDGSNFPTISIVGDGAVSEGDDAVFTVNTDESDMMRVRDLVVAIAVSEGSTSFISGTPTKNVIIPGGSTSASYRVETSKDLYTTGADGTITATIKPGANYKLPASGGSASVMVNEIRLPKVSIISGATTTGVTEGYEFDFTVRVDRNHE